VRFSPLGRLDEVFKLRAGDLDPPTRMRSALHGRSRRRASGFEHRRRFVRNDTWASRVASERLGPRRARLRACVLGLEDPGEVHGLEVRSVSRGVRVGDIQG